MHFFLVDHLASHGSNWIPPKIEDVMYSTKCFKTTNLLTSMDPHPKSHPIHLQIHRWFITVVEKLSPFSRTHPDGQKLSPEMVDSLRFMYVHVIPCLLDRSYISLEIMPIKEQSPIKSSTICAERDPPSTWKTPRIYPICFETLTFFMYLEGLQLLSYQWLVFTGSPLMDSDISAQKLIVQCLTS